MFDKIFVNPIYKKHRESLVSIADLSIVVFSYGITLIFVWLLDKELLHAVRTMHVVVGILAIIVSFFISFRIFKVQKSLWKYIGFIEVIRVAASVVLSCALLSFVLLFTGADTRWIVYGLLGAIITFLTMLTFRVIYRAYRRVTTSAVGDKNFSRAVIIGAGDAGYILSKEASQNRNLRVKIVGFVDDKRTDLIISGIPVLGKVNELEIIKSKYNISMALIAIPSASKDEINRIVSICKDLDLDIKIMREDSLFVDPSGQQRVSVDDISIEDLLGRREVEFATDEVESYIKGKVVMVTGAAGSIGSELCRQIVKFKPKQLVMLDVNENGLYMLEQEFLRNKRQGNMSECIEVLSIIASIREKDALDDVISSNRVEVVYHAAAHKHVPLMETRPMEAIKNNVFGTNNLIHSCIENKVERLIMISTDKAVNPTNVMGGTKRLTEMLLQANGNNGVTKMAAVRFGNVLGSNGSVIPIFQEQIKSGGPVTITDKKIKRYFMTIPEASQLVLQAGYYADQGEIFVLDMGEPELIINLAEKMIRLAGYRPYIDIDIVEIGLRPGEKMFEELVLNQEVTEKTENEMIFMNKTMAIDKESLENYLHQTLKDLVKNGTGCEIKTSLLDYIKE